MGIYQSVADESLKAHINIAPVALQRPATPWRPVASQPLGDIEVVCSVGLGRAYKGQPALILLFYPLTLLCAS